MPSTTIDKKVNPEHQDSVLLEVIENLGAQIDFGKNMLNLGSKTELIDQISKLISDPIKSHFSHYRLSKNELNQVADGLIKKALFSQKDIILHSFKSESDDDGLYYCIVLKKDNRKNRSVFFDILRNYGETPFVETCPVYFRFIPSRLKDKIKIAETIF